MHYAKRFGAERAAAKAAEARSEGPRPPSADETRANPTPKRLQRSNSKEAVHTRRRYVNSSKDEESVGETAAADTPSRDTIDTNVSSRGKPCQRYDLINTTPVSRVQTRWPVYGSVMPQHEIEKRAARRVVAGRLRSVISSLSHSRSRRQALTLKAFSMKPIRRQKELWLIQHQTLNFEKWRGPPVGKIWCSRRGCLSSAFTVRLG